MSKKSHVAKRRAGHSGLALFLLALLPVLAHSTTTQLRSEGQLLTLELSEQFAPAIQTELIDWLDHISTVLLQVYGRWPRDHWAIEVTPVEYPGSDPIPWAQVQRGEVNRVQFYTLPNTSARVLKQSWTSYHELSHLLIPYRGWGDMWFSEGLATYYQNVLQARSGVYEEPELWRQLYAGFMRGRAQTRFDGVDLQTLSPSMRNEGSYMRVYWSGVWYFLKADVSLRHRSGGERSLDTALEKLNRCCANQKMSVLQMVRKLDQLNELDFFYPLYLETIASTTVPSFEQLFSALGVSIDSKGEPTLVKSGAPAKLRLGISKMRAL